MVCSTMGQQAKKKKDMEGFVLDYRGGIFTVKTGKQRNRLPRQAVQSLSLMESQDPTG